MSGKFTNTSNVVKDQNGNIHFMESDIVDGWAEPIRLFLDRGDPTQPPAIDIDNNNIDELDISVKDRGDKLNHKQSTLTTTT